MATADKVLRRVTDGYTYAGVLDLIIMTCPACGITYAMPHALQKNAYERGNREITWYCPNGHSLGYNGESEEEKKRKQLERQLQSSRENAAWMASQRDQAKAEAKAQKGRATRFKNERDKVRQRIAAGVCPCCSRNFRSVEQHMRMKHPDEYAKFKAHPPHED